MPVITDITAVPRKPGRFAVLVDGKPHAVLSADLVATLGVRVGGTLTEPLDAAITDAAATLHTYDRALNMLAFRARSATELRRSLVRKGEEPARVDAAIERLRAAGLIDDEQFARQFARSRVSSAGASRRKLEQELYRKGVGREISSEAIAEVMEEEDVDEDALVERAALKKLRTLGRVDEATRRRRLYGYLARRGYDSDRIRGAMERVLSGGTDEDLHED